MATVHTQISTVDALIALYQSLTKANKKKFRTILAAEDAKKAKSANAINFVALSSKAEEEMRKGKTIHFESASDAQKWMDEL